MTRLKLGEIAHEYKGKAKESEMGVLPIVGLEHLSSGDIDLVGFSEGGESTFTKKFLPGHVLFGRRRAYQRKASLAEFPGICSGDITVIEADEGALEPRLLPFIIQNDSLFDFAVENSAGSLSPRVKWARLAEYELDLPTLENQRELADILWAAQDVRRKYKQLLRASDDIVKSRFVEMFGDPVLNPMKWKLSTIKETALNYGDGPFGSKLKAAHYTESGARVIRLGNIAQGAFLDDDRSFISLDYYAELEKYTCKPGEVVIATLGDPILRACIVPDFGVPCIHKADCMYYETDKSKVLPVFAMCAINHPSMLARAMDDVHGQTRGRINSTQTGNLPILMPPIELQQEFVTFVSQVDKSKVALQQSLDELNATMAAILNEELGTRDV